MRGLRQADGPAFVGVEVLASSRLGRAGVERSHFRGRSCGKGCLPLDLTLGLEDGTVTPGMEASSPGRCRPELRGGEPARRQPRRGGRVAGPAAAPGAEARRGGGPLPMDGTGVPMRREETEGVRGRQADGTPETREARLAVIYTAEGRDPETGAAVEDRRGGSFSCLTAGAAAPSGGREPAPSRNRHREVEACCRHFGRNPGRMRYGGFRERGVQAGSGVVEGGCRQFGLRPRRSGTRWPERGANAMFALKSCVMNLRLPDFLEWRANQAIAA